jgi:serine/threonine protein kinase
MCPVTGDNVATDELLGATIAGRYRIISRLGAGGMGVAYRAWDEQGGLPVVIKIPKKSFLEDPKFAERFYREIRLLQGLKHPRIVPIVDVGEHEGLPFVVMRFLPGGSLSNRRLRDEKGKPRQNFPETLHLWLPAIADALDYVHSQGVVHRDVKPGNIFFDAFWGAYLGDFGIAKIVEESDAFDKEHTLTATHMGIGTPDYMAPEQFTPKAVIDGRADQYALGVIVYEMLAGKRPFVGDTAHIVVEVTTHPVPALSVPRGQVPPLLAESVYRALAKHPSQRFATCRDFAAAALRDVQPMTDEPGVARLLCPQCSNILKLPTAAAGQKGKCPKCQTQMKVADDLGALWLLDEARKQRKAAEVGGDEIPRTPSDGGDDKAPETFEPVSSETPVPQKKRLPQSVLVAGVAGVVLALLVIAIGLFGGTIEPPPPSPPQPPPYDVRLAAAQRALERDSRDPGANDFLARHYCFKEKDWKKGLPCLAKSGMPDAASLAKEEIAATEAKPVVPGTLVRLARKWWDYGGRTDLNTPESAAATRLHAKDIYAEHVEKITDQSDADWANQWLDSDKNFAQLVKNLRPAPRVVLKAGLLASLYKYQQGEPGGFLPTDFAGKPDEIAVHTQVAFQPRHGIGDFSIKERFHLVWNGILRVEKAGLYKFFLNSDDGSKLTIDGKLVIDNGGEHGMAEKAGQTTLASGDYVLHVELFDQGSETGCVLSWEPPGLSREVVPPQVFFHDSTRSTTRKTLIQHKEIFLSELPEIEAKAVHFGFGKGTINGPQNAIRSIVDDQPSPHGLSMHPGDGPQGHCYAKYQLPLGVSRFQAVVTLDKRGSFQHCGIGFEVVTDGQSVWKSKTIDKSHQSEKCDVVIAGCRNLELRTFTVTAAFGGHAVWIEPRIVIDPRTTTSADEARASITDKAAAEWVLQRGGSVEIEMADKSRKRLAAPEELASLSDQAGQFLAVGIELTAKPNVTDQGLACVAGLSRLEWLGVGGTAVTDALFDHLRTLPNLRGIGVNWTGVSGRGLASLADSQLKHLEISGMKDPEVAVAYLHKKGVAEWINFDGMKMTPECVRLLGEMKTLKTLHFRSGLITEEQLETLKKKLPTCHFHIWK